MAMVSILVKLNFVCINFPNLNFSAFTLLGLLKIYDVRKLT